MGPMPTPLHTIDRFPNGEGNYEPGNCRWATRTEQARNRKSSVIVEFHGKKQTMDEWEKELGFGRGILYYRLRVCGWPVEKALTKPQRPHPRRKTVPA